MEYDKQTLVILAEMILNVAWCIPIMVLVYSLYTMHAL
jgi:hypothetical protein